LAEIIYFLELYLISCDYATWWSTITGKLPYSGFQYYICEHDDENPDRGDPRVRRPYFAGRLLTCASLALTLAIAGATATAASRCVRGWVGAWGFDPIPALSAHGRGGNNPKPFTAPVPGFGGRTVRQIVRISAAATCIRVRISNEFGKHALYLGNISIALAASGGAVVPGSSHVVKFSGRTAIAVPAGAPVVSDALRWRVPALTRLAVSVYLPRATTPPAHRVYEFLSSFGDFVASPSMPGARRELGGALVSEVDIVSPTARHTVVTLGDSITEGFGSTPDAFRGWPDRLADRLQAHRATQDWAVVNAGINSNRLLHDGPGMGALARFDRDVLSVPGVSMVILLEGINDIGYSHMKPAQAVTADDIIAAYRQLIARAHEHGLRIVAGTISPYEGAHYFSRHGERMREAVNQWIRGSGDFDAVIDFDAMLRDPRHPVRIKPGIQRGDDLHPNDAGYALMARGISLRFFGAPHAAESGRRADSPTHAPRSTSASTQTK
jgi:lysophospholipase L1-like esterase